MAKCPFAKWTPLNGAVGTFVGGPYRIVHHTTEGSTAAGALAAFKKNKSDPHFTVDGTTIYQHIDTAQAARALRNLGGGVQTNRYSAIQIEVVGTATRPKQRATLENVARLCRWLEKTHAIPSVWPSGPTKTAINGRDPGGHNRNAANWQTKGGHYGHSQVPENIHWDPAYTAEESHFVLTWDPDNDAGLIDPALYALRDSFPEEVTYSDADFTMHDHGDVADNADAKEAAKAKPKSKAKPKAKSAAD
jgi:hypothetical protein